MPTENDRPNDLPLLLTVQETGRELRVCDRQVYDLCEEGVLDMVKVGKKSTRITSASVQRLAAQRGKPTAYVPGLKQYHAAKKRRLAGRRRQSQKD